MPSVPDMFEWAFKLLCIIITNAISSPWNKHKHEFEILQKEIKYGFSLKISNKAGNKNA